MTPSTASAEIEASHDTARQDEIPLSLAAYCLGESYYTARNMLLRGVLRGRQLRGKWLVSRASIDQLLKARGEPALTTSVA